jgi:hypothetical protein
LAPQRLAAAIDVVWMAVRVNGPASSVGGEEAVDGGLRFVSRVQFHGGDTLAVRLRRSEKDDHAGAIVSYVRDPIAPNEWPCKNICFPSISGIVLSTFTVASASLLSRMKYSGPLVAFAGSARSAHRHCISPRGERIDNQSGDPLGLEAFNDRLPRYPIYPIINASAPAEINDGGNGPAPERRFIEMNAQAKPQIRLPR